MNSQIGNENFFGSNSVVHAINIWHHLSKDEKSKLLDLVHWVQGETAETIRTLCSNPKWQESVNEKETICPVELLRSPWIELTDKIIEEVADIFGYFYIVKDMREMTGLEAFEFAKKYSRYLDEIAYSTLIRQVMRWWFDGVNINELILFVEDFLYSAAWAMIDERFIPQQLQRLKGRYGIDTEKNDNSHENANTTIVQEAIIVQEPIVGSVSPDLLFIARRNANNPRLRWSGWGKARKWARKIGRN